MGRHRITFKHALSGVRYSLKTQSCFSVHIPVAMLVIFLGIFLKITYIEWLMLIFTIILVLASEMMNTAIESVTDLVTSEYRVEAKIAKDVSAGMVLVTAIGSAVVGLLIFGPKLINLFG